MSNLFRFSLILALVFSGAKVFGYESNGTRNQSNTASASRYQVSGDRQGQVTVTDKVSRQVIRTFQMETGVVVRETFLLDNGRTVAASQKDLTIFWDLATGNEIKRFPMRIYGFSHDEKKFFSYHYPEGVYLLAYPELTLICPLLEERTFGPMLYRFSPDDRFLSISFAAGYPQSDEYYPNVQSITSGIIYAKLFDLQNCHEIKQFSQHRFQDTGEFSNDSRFLYLKNEFILLKGQPSMGSWLFDLTTYQVERTE